MTLPEHEAGEATPLVRTRRALRWCRHVSREDAGVEMSRELEDSPPFVKPVLTPELGDGGEATLDVEEGVVAEHGAGDLEKSICDGP